MTDIDGWTLAALVLVVGLLAYLVTALLNPEDFS